MISYDKLYAWVDEIAALLQPDEIYWCDGSEEEYHKMMDQMVEQKKAIALNPLKRPGSYAFFSDPSDVARVEDRTFIASVHKDDAGPTNNWIDPKELKETMTKLYKGSMKGRTMYVIPFMMGPFGSPLSKVGIELTDSAYVAANMRIMTRMGRDVLKELENTKSFVPCVHSVGYPLEEGQEDLEWPSAPIEKKYIAHFPEDRLIWSVGSGYGGNVLLGKKCLALRIASVLGRDEGWLAEHMLIMGIEDPSGYIAYVAAAFPSACGKTNLAMLIPPKGLRHKGYRIWTVGDDISWMRIDSDGTLWAINPEYGMFGVAPGTNSKTNPNAMITISKNTIFTNVLLSKDGTVWWEDGEGDPPKEGIDWMGRPWRPGMKDELGKIIKGAHPNSRFTAPISQCPSVTNRLEHHHGVPISAIMFGGRRAKVAPLVYEAFSWQHGVFVGASMASERTAAQFGKQGELRHDPMAMLPFCGYNMGDYFKHWLKMGRKMSKPPKIFHVNWFRTDKKGNFLWPGFGENLRILEWIIARCRYSVGAKKTAIGNVPKLEDIDMAGLKMSKKDLEQALSVHKKDWILELKSQEEFFKKFGKFLPQEIWQEHRELKKRLGF